MSNIHKKIRLPKLLSSTYMLIIIGTLWGSTVVSTNKNQLLIQYSRKGKLEKVRTLLGQNAEVNTTNQEKATPLHCASEQGHHHVVHELLEAGADPDLTDEKGNTPLHMACNGRVAIELIGKMHDINALNFYSRSPLYMACEKERPRVVEELLRNGAEIRASTVSKFTKKKHCKITSILLQRGAIPPNPNEHQFQRILHRIASIKRALSKNKLPLEPIDLITLDMAIGDKHSVTKKIKRKPKQKRQFFKKPKK